ncbi:MAG: type III pantothenate kinase [Pseudomonadota bacterium]
MRLYVDLGHSRIKWMAHGDTCGLVSGAADAAGNHEALAEQWSRLPGPAEVTVASVGTTRAVEMVRRAVECLGGATIHWLHTPSSGWGVHTAYHEPERLGVDRFAALVAAHARHPDGAIVCDVGTAATIDVMVAGDHQGGVILPGLQSQKRSLVESVGLSGTDSLHTGSPLGCTTEEGVDLGPAYALVGACSMVQSADPAYAGLPMLMTGGDAEQVLTRAPETWNHLPRLVLEGIEIMARQIQDGKT